MVAAQSHQHKQQQASEPGYRFVPSCRLLVALTCLMGGTVNMLGRVQVSFAVLCMVRDAPDNHSAAENGTASPHISQLGEFDWSKQFQGLVLSAYFYGYVAFLVIGGWVADRLPSHKVAIVSALCQGLMLALMPEATRLHPVLLIVLRVLQGGVASAYYPSFNVILRNWSTAGEFALIFSIAWSGGYLGSATAFPVSSVLCQATGWLGGWPLIFYVSALALAGWALAACFILTESPEHHLFVSEAEKKYLVSQPHMQTTDKQQKQSVSICTLLSNLQVWIIAFSYFATSWFFAALNITLPTFMKEGFNFDITENGFVSALPSLTMGVMIILGGKAFHYIHVDKGFSNTNSRKILSVIGLLVPSGLMLAVILMPASQRYLSVICISLAQGFSSIVIGSGTVSAAADIAPQYIGFIWGIASSFGNTTGFLAPIIAAAMTPNGTLAEWCRFFVISIVQMGLLSVLIACCWRSEVQPFARSDALKSRVVSQRHAQTLVALEEAA